jgi:linoleate 10R-lipoxygenase
MRALPNHYTADSTYTWFPLMTPEAMQGVLTKLGDAQVYSLKRPLEATDAVVVSEYREAKQVLEDEKFGPLWTGRAEKVIRGKGSVSIVASLAIRSTLS